MNQNNILVSIIIATYNAENYLGTVLESLVGKINGDTEVIIIDGLSQDNTLKIANKYIDYIDRISSEKDLGIYDAMNKGVSMAKGKFILFLGADDELVININELSAILISEDVIYYGDVIVTPSNKGYGGKFNLEKLLNRNICHQSIFYPRSTLLINPFNLRYKLLADYVLNMQLWSSKKWKFCYIDKLIAKYSLEGFSSNNTDLQFKKDSFKIVYSLFGLYGLVIKCFNPIRRALKF